MRPLLKESFMFKVSKNAKISFFVKSKNLVVVRVTNEGGSKFFIEFLGVPLKFEFNFFFKKGKKFL